jgi:hypothetical protein
MGHYGAIYLLHNALDGEEVFKVGATTREVKTRVKELTAETSNLGAYDECGHIVVTDVEAAEKACHHRLREFRIQSNREFFKLGRDELVIHVEKACARYTVRAFFPKEGFAHKEDTSGSPSIKNLFERASKSKELSDDLAHRELLDIKAKYETSVLKVSDLSSQLLELLSDFGDRTEVVFTGDEEGNEVVGSDDVPNRKCHCHVILKAPLEMGDDISQIVISEHIQTENGVEKRTRSDDGAYARLSFSVFRETREIVGEGPRTRVIYTVTGDRPVFDLESNGSEFTQVWRANLKDWSASNWRNIARLSDLEDSMQLYVKFIASNTSSLLTKVHRNVEVDHRGRHRVVEGHEFRLDLSALAPHTTSPQEAKRQEREFYRKRKH